MSAKEINVRKCRHVTFEHEPFLEGWVGVRAEFHPHPAQHCIHFFVYFLVGYSVLATPFLYVAHFCIFDSCLDSNRSKQARYKLSHPSPTHLYRLMFIKIFV
jgi:hypothetical protein